MTLNFAIVCGISSLVLCDSNALAAQQGELSISASAGQFTNTLGIPSNSLRKVQVLGVVDALVRKESPLLAVDGVALEPGIRDNFCVVDTLNGTVNLTFTRVDNENGWVAKDVEGRRMDYRMLVSTTLNGRLRNIAIGAPVAIAGFTAVNRPELCGGGNISKGVTARTAFLPNITYIDTVLLTATPQ